MSEQIDRSLILELQAGSLEALGAIFDRYRETVHRTAAAITGSSEAADELLQHVFLQLHRNARRLDPDHPLAHWLYRETLGRASGWVRRDRLLRPVEGFGRWLAGSVAVASPLAVARAEEWRVVEQAILALPLAQRAVVVLYYINDLSTAEIAEIIDAPVGAVESRLDSGRAALRESMESDTGKLSEVKYEFT